MVREEGDKFHCQVGGSTEGLSAQDFVEQGSGRALMLFSNFDVNGSDSLALRLYQGGSTKDTCCGEGVGLRGFIPIPDILEL